MKSSCFSGLARGAHGPGRPSTCGCINFLGENIFVFLVSVILILVFLGPVHVMAVSVTVAWNRDQEPDIAGYRIYYGASPGVYSSSLTVFDSANEPIQRDYLIDGFFEGRTYHFALKAFDLAGQESDYSEEFSLFIPWEIVPGNGNDGWWESWYLSQDWLEIGRVNVDHAWQTVALDRDFENPVVIAGPPTRNENAPCTVRVRNVTSHSFDVRIQEWAYLDERHQVESVSYMVVEAGERLLPDGSLWQAGIRPLGGVLTWHGLTLPSALPAEPIVLQTVQTENDPDPVVIRMKDVTGDGFATCLQEEEARQDGHGTEMVGYLAIAPGNTDLDLYEIDLNQKFSAVAPDTVVLLALEEEKSRDPEMKHCVEKVGVLMVEEEVFAQIMSFVGTETAGLRKRQR